MIRVNKKQKRRNNDRFFLRPGTDQPFVWREDNFNRFFIRNGTGF